MSTPAHIRGRPGPFRRWRAPPEATPCATFLGSLTWVSALLSGDVTVQVGVPSVESAALAPGTSVQVSVAAAEVLVAGRR